MSSARGKFKRRVPFKELKTRKQKRRTIIDAVIVAAMGDARCRVTASDVAHELGISDATAAKYMREMAREDILEAEPPLDFKSCGAARRMYRIYLPEDDR